MTILLLVAPQIWGLTTSEFIGLLPEMLNAMNSSFLLIYTIMSASFVAFFAFGWIGNYFVRFLGGLVVIALLQGASLNLERTLATYLDMMYTWRLEVGCESEALNQSLNRFPQGYFEESIQFNCGAPIEGSYENMLSGIPFAVEGSLLYTERSNILSALNPFRPFLLFIARPWMFIPLFLSMGIWFFCPSKDFFRRKGWVSE